MSCRQSNDLHVCGKMDAPLWMLKPAFGLRGVGGVGAKGGGGGGGDINTMINIR